MSTQADSQPIQMRLAEAYRELPEAMRRIADALMSDPLLGALWGIEVMSERAEVSVGTVVRFAKRLGYKGFSEFRDSLREACHARSGDAELELMEVPSDVFGTLAEVARQAHLDIYLTDVGFVICQTGDPPFPNGKAENGEVWKTIYKANMK